MAPGNCVLPVQIWVSSPEYLKGGFLQRRMIPAYDRIITRSHKSEDGCIEFFGAPVDGYGRVKVGGRNGKMVLASRVVWEHERGPIPKGICVCHHCDKPSCVNIDHLFLGTHQDNMTDMTKKGRAFISFGEKSGNHKLTSDQVHSIRLDTRMQTTIAKEYGVSKSLICEIKSGKHRIYE